MMEQSLKIPLLLSILPGLHPLHKNAFQKCRKLITFVVVLYFNLSMFVDILFNFDGLTTMIKYDILPAIFMIIAKFLTFHFYEDHLTSILQSIRDLWPLGRFGTELEAKLLWYHSAVATYLKSYIVSFGFCALAFYILPIITGKLELGIPGYELCDLNVTWCFATQQSLQALSCYTILLPTVCAFDCLFLGLTVYVCTSVDVLKTAFQKFDATSATKREDFRDLVKQHNTILKIIHDTDAFYNGSLSFQFLGSTGQLFFCLYMLSSEGIPPPTDILLKYGITYVIFLAQLFQFCICGTVIAEKTKTVADEVFMVNWWAAPNATLKKNLAFVIQEAQKGKQLTVGKMINLDLESFVQVLKISLQLYMLMSAAEISGA